MSPSTETRIEYSVPVTMSDGVILYADVYRPAANGQYPTILARTPYDKFDMQKSTSVAFGFDPLAAVRSGYVVVVQDVRGTFESEGRFHPFAHDSNDGAATVAWAAAQGWSNGSVGMAGGSTLGDMQLLAAVHAPPALKAIAPAVTGSEFYDGMFFQGGAFQLYVALTWLAAMAHLDLLRSERRGEDVTNGREVLEAVLADPWFAMKQLPLAELPRRTRWLSYYGDWLSHPDRDEFWHPAATNQHYGLIDVPALHITGWSDVLLKGSLENYTGLRRGAASRFARRNQRLIVTPWGHALPSETIGDLSFGTAASPGTVDLTAAHFEFFDEFLRNGRAPVDLAPVRIFVMGKNQWRSEDDWPLTRAVPSRFYLRAGGRLAREAPADEGADMFSYDPRNPVPTTSGCTGWLASMGPRDRCSVEARPDVITYTSAVLSEDLEVTGPVTARLFVATSALDTDFTVALADVYPDGRAIGIADGILRLRYRDGLDSQHLARPGTVYEIEVDLVATSNLFRAGHCIRIEVSSSNFPRFDRNPNHGGVIAEATDADLITATQHVFHDANRASFVTLPIVPG